MAKLKKLAVLGAVAAIASAGVVPLAASAAPTKDPKPTIVLVHGAFAESASWNGVIARLRQRGYPVIAAANPLRSLEGDIAYLRQVLAGIHGPIVLAGHSYGGMVISGAAAGNPQVEALAYIAAFAPETGESALELSNKFPGSILGPTLDANPLGDGTNDLTIKQEKFRTQFAADVPRDEAALMAATQRPVRDAALNAPAGPGAWHTIPSWFVIPAADKNIPLTAQRFMAQRAHAREVVESRGASHAVTVSRPDEVAALIAKAAR
ncbi:alpha/beta fold hydrolase [Kibdelosporangium phytohabitans]|uniref:Alpha/beta hydrolase n=1 Tax=Kibdelosporangium phytohabitans TaxID=860235 RepID=A0A0N9HXN6_9PSEU|nr:alpha/beta hydrolase [Kibdelosporangium phytohabitans]ALG07026.1 alpha/beta hydrolase [Kibdelosporangium phytohabitans]MBE1468317.1 pimeloyl-ACP methyl ester carboxylesterase [Kibdelosporangium phytohabitans]